MNRLRAGFDEHFDRGPETWTTVEFDIILDGIAAQIGLLGSAADPSAAAGS